MSSEPHSLTHQSPLGEESLGPGRLRLKLTMPVPLDGGRLCDLSVDIEGRPGDSLLHRRGRVKSAVVEVSQAQLSRVIATQLPSLCAQLPVGLVAPDRLAVRFCGSDDKPQLFVVARFPDAGPQPLWCSLRLPLGPGRQDLRGPRRSSEPLTLSLGLYDADLRVYGLAQRSVALLGLSAAICVGAALLCFRSASTESVVLPATEFAPGLGMRLLFAHGLREVGVDVLWDSLLQVMPRHGQRVADAKSAALALIERQDGLLRLSYEGLGSSFDFDDDPRGRSTVDGGQIESLLLADRLLIEGDVPAALAAYELVGRVASFSDAAALRRAQILATVPKRSDEVLPILDGLAAKRSFDIGTQLLALAVRVAGSRSSSSALVAQRDALCALAQSEEHTAEEQALLMLWAAQLPVGDTDSLDLAQKALERVSADPNCPTAALVADGAAALLQALSTRLLFESSSLPPAVESSEISTELALADRCFVAGELSTAAVHYRRALVSDQVPKAELARVHMRLAEIAHHHSDLAEEEAELGLAVECGGGAAAWSALAALFQSLGDGARLGVALYAWSLHEVGDARADLLRQASRHVGPSLLLAIDEALLQIGADDELLRERLLRRRKQQDDHVGLLSLLIRDMHQSSGARRWASARLAADVARRLGDVVTEAEATLLALSAPANPSVTDDDAMRALGLLAGEQRTLIPPETVSTLRNRLKARGSLRTVLRRLDQRLALLASATAPTASLVDLYRQSALCMSLLDEWAAAVVRYLRAAALGDRTVLPEVRKLLALLLADGQHQQARRLIEAELRRCPTEQAAPLRVALGEVLLRSGRPREALGQLELSLLRDEELPVAHALLGQILHGLGQPEDRPRALSHLLAASQSSSLSPVETGECALLAAQMLLASEATVRLDADLAVANVPTLPKEVQKQAERMLQRAIEFLPKDPRPRRLLISHHVAKQQPERALSLCDELLELAQTDAERADVLWQKSQLVRDESEAEALLQSALLHDENHLPTLTRLRARAEQRGDKAAALSWLSRELVASPSDSERALLLCKQAELLDPQSQADLILTTLRKAMQLGLGQAGQRLAALLWARGDLLQAADIAGRAAQLLPPSEQGNQLLLAAEWALRVGDELRAREYLRQASEQPGESAEEAAQRLVVLDGGDEPANRRRTLENRLTQVSTGLSSIETLRQLLILCARQNDLVSVERYAQALLSQVPLDGLGLTALTDCLIATGRSQESVFPQLQISREYPRRGPVLEARAEWLIKRGESSEAESHLNEALAHAARGPERLRIGQQLAELHRRRNAHGLAAATLSGLLSDVDEREARAALRRRIAALYVQAGQPLVAIEELRSLLAELPTDLLALEQLFGVALGCDDLQSARACLDQLVSHSTGAIRARWLCRRAELHQRQGSLSDALSDAEAALASSQDPDLLRALLLLGVQLSDGGLIRQTTMALHAQGAPFLAASALAGCGLLLHAIGPPEQAERLLSPLETPDELALAMAQSVAGFRGPLPDVDRLLDPLRRRKLPRFETLRKLLEQRAFGQTVDLGALKLLARLTEADWAPLHALYLSALAFVDPLGEPAQRLDVLPKVRFSPSEERLPEPTDELRPLATLLSHFARLLLRDTSSRGGVDLGPVQRVRERQAQLFAKMGGELVGDLSSLRALLGAATALWLPGHEPKTEAERQWLRSLQARALLPGQPSLTTEQAHLLLDPVRHELATSPEKVTQQLGQTRELFHRRALLLAAVEQHDLRPALWSLLPAHEPMGEQSHGPQPGEPTEPHDRLALLSQPPLRTLLLDAQRLLS